MKQISIALLASSLIAASAFAEEQRHAGKHEHGHGTLSIAIENNRVAIELEAPGMDIAGFEHAAKTDDQKAAVEKARTTLAKPLELFQMPAAAGCSVIDAKASVEAEKHLDDRDTKDLADGTGHDAKDHDEAHDEEAGGHSEFHAVYVLECTKPAQLTTIKFDYFKAFANAQELEVTVVTSQSQNSYEVTRDKPVLDLSGVM